MISLFRRFLHWLNDDTFAVVTKRANGVTYKKLYPSYSSKGLNNYSPHYDYRRFQEMYRTLYAVKPILVEELFHEFEMKFCSGDKRNAYSIIYNFIIGYQILNGMHIVGNEYCLDHRLWPTESQLDQLRIDFPGYQFRRQKGYEGDDWLAIKYLGTEVPSKHILELHNKLGSK